MINGQQGITIKNLSSRSFLTVNNVTEEHFGNYTCVATNRLGTTNASLLLNRKLREMVMNNHFWLSLYIEEQNIARLPDSGHFKRTMVLAIHFFLIIWVDFVSGRVQCIVKFKTCYLGLPRLRAGSHMALVHELDVWPSTIPQYHSEKAYLECE